jgi:hypothetical protein
VRGYRVLFVVSLVIFISMFCSDEMREITITNHLVAALDQTRRAESIARVLGRTDDEDVQKHVESAQSLLMAIENEPGVENRLRVLKKRLKRFET